MAARPYYGWTIVGALAISETISWGVLSYAFGVFVTPMERDLGWSRAELTGAVSVGALVTGVAAVPVGRWIDRHGARLLMTAGSIVGSAMVLAWSMVESLPVFYLIWAGIGLAMAATLYEPAFAVIAVWFERRRGQALTVLTFAAGFASTIFLPLSDWLVSVQGWRGALASLAVLLAVSTVPLHALVLRRRPADLGLQPDGAMVAAASTHRETAVSLREAVSQPAFAALAAAFFLVSLATTALTVNLVPLLISRPLDPALAATIGGLVGAASSFGRLALAPWWGRFAPATIAAGVFLLLPAGVLGLLVPGAAGAVIFAVLFGITRGVGSPLRSLLIVERFGTMHYASISGALAIVVVGATALAPVASGLLYDATGSYIPMLLLVAAAAIVGSALVRALQPSRPKIV